MFDRKLLALASIAIAMAGLTNAQEPSTTLVPPPATAEITIQEGGVPSYVSPETAAQRKARLGTAVDPGLNPDPKEHYWRFGKSFHIDRYERKWAAYDQSPGFVRPMGMVNATFEIYQQNEKYVWIWAEDQDQTVVEKKAEVRAEVEANRYTPYAVKFFEKIRPQFAPLDPPVSAKTLHFEASSNGLPNDGSWRNSLSVADMNGDGHMDIVAPPERGSRTNAPVIYLGDGKGHWKFWQGVVWPHGINYGSAVAADFNKDGHMDVAFGVHLSGVVVFLGDGKGHFTEVSEGLPKGFATRRIRVADLNGDGWPDIVAVTEGPSVQDQNSPDNGPVRAFINRKKGLAFEAVNVAAPGVKTGADWLTIGNFNGDKYPDMAIGSIFVGSWDILYLGQGPLKWASWDKNDGDVVPSLSYYFGNAAGRFSRKDRDDVIISYVRFWPTDLPSNVVAPPANTQLTALDRISFSKDGTPTRTPIVHWENGEELRGVAVGDFDHDGNLDIIYTHLHPREAVILLGDGKGGFARATVEGLTVSPLINYDITVADVNADGLPDVVLMYEASEQKNPMAKKDGSIQVFLNRGTGAAVTAGERK